MGIISTGTGDEFLGFYPGTEPMALEAYPDLPLVFSCVIARYHGNVLYVFNSWREEWELPAGMIEAGETPQDAGIRELKEESGQVVSGLHFAGMCLLRLKKGQLELGAIYTCELEAIRPFDPNDEISAIMFWDRQQRVEGNVDEISIALSRLLD